MQEFKSKANSVTERVVEAMALNKDCFMDLNTTRLTVMKGDDIFAIAKRLPVASSWRWSLPIFVECRARGLRNEVQQMLDVVFLAHYKDVKVLVKTLFAFNAAVVARRCDLTSVEISEAYKLAVEIYQKVLK